MYIHIFFVYCIHLRFNRSLRLLQHPAICTTSFDGIEINAHLFRQSTHLFRSKFWFLECYSANGSQQVIFSKCLWRCKDTRCLGMNCQISMVSKWFSNSFLALLSSVPTERLTGTLPGTAAAFGGTVSSKQRLWTFNSNKETTNYEKCAKNFLRKNHWLLCNLCNWCGRSWSWCWLWLWCRSWCRVSSLDIDKNWTNFDGVLHLNADMAQLAPYLQQMVSKKNTKTIPGFRIA